MFWAYRLHRPYGSVPLNFLVYIVRIVSVSFLSHRRHFSASASIISTSPISSLGSELVDLPLRSTEMFGQWLLDGYAKFSVFISREADRQANKVSALLDEGFNPFQTPRS